MEPLDGNAVAGDLMECFGAEMTTAVGACANCGTEAMIGALHVYVRAPGSVGRCRHCGEVTFVVVTVRDQTLVDFSGFILREVPAEG
jgi:ribosomal protein S11